MRKKKLMNRILAGALAFSMVFQTPAAVLAQETGIVTASEQETSAKNETDDNNAQAGNVSNDRNNSQAGNVPSDNISAGTGTANDSGSSGEDGSAGDVNDSADPEAGNTPDNGNNAQPSTETTPQSESAQSENAPQSESTQSGSVPQSESAQSGSVPQSESTQSGSVPQSESAQSEGDLQSESAQSEGDLQPESAQSESSPQPENTRPESKPQSECQSEPEVETEIEIETESETETEEISEEESEQHAAAEITHQMDQLKLHLSDAWYAAEDGARVMLADMQGGVDYRGIPETLLLPDREQEEEPAGEPEDHQVTSGVSVLYRLQADGEARSVRAGDWFTVTFPEWMKNLRLTEDGQVCKKGDDTQLDGIRCELDAQARRLKVTFTKKIDKKKSTGIHGKIGVAFEWDRALLAGKSAEAALVLQNQNGNENRSVILLPEKLLTDDEPESESETEPETEVMTELERESETELSAEFARPLRAPKKDDGVTIEKGGSAQAQIIWQDAVAGETHPMQAGTVVCTIQTVAENETDIIHTETYELAYGTDGYLVRNDTLWELFRWNETGERPQVQLSGENALNQSLTLGDLPSKRIAIEQIEEAATKKTVQKISWEIRVGGAPDGYLMAADTANRVYTMTPATTFTARVEMRSGETVSDAEWQALKENLKIYRDGAEQSPQEIIDRFVPGTKEPEIIIESGENGAATLKITGLPWCSADKAEYVYSAAAGGKNAEEIHQEIVITDGSGDVLIQSIDNAESANFGSVTEEVHEGGLLVLTRFGKLDFAGTKIWLDEGEMYRPEKTIWELWRFTRGKGNYRQAAPVRDAAGIPITAEVSRAGAPLTPIEISFPELSKYDASGEAYVYFVKEVMTGETAPQYEKVFGTLKKDADDHPVGVDTSADTAPNWNMDGETVEDEMWQRGDDPSIYNGGTVCNRHKDTVTVEQAKAWIAANYQDDLHNVSVELTLQRRLKGRNADAQVQWTDTEIKEVLTDFTAEQMVKSVEATMPKYDELGREMEYRWQETSVWETKDGVQSGNLLQSKEDGTQIFRLSHNEEAEKVDGGEYYISEIAEADTADYPAGTIVNRLVGTTRYDVRKVWSDQIKDLPDSITVVLKQRGTDGTVKEFEYTLNNPQGGSRQWDLAITTLPSGAALPKYDANGRKYTYIVEEIKIPDGADYTPQYEYNNRDTLVDGSTDDPKEEVKEDVNNALITNIPIGAGRLIRVRKEWLDDGDAAHREYVTIEVYRKKIDGNPLDDGTDKLLATVELSEGKQWWSFVNVTEFAFEKGDTIYVGTQEELTAQGFDTSDFTAEHVYDKEDAYYIKETKMGEREVDTKERSLRGYPSISAETGTGLHQHGYEVLYANPNGDNTSCTDPDEDGYYTVYNRRLGQIDIDVTKTWVDGGQDAKTRAELGAVLVLSGAGTQYEPAPGSAVGQGGLSLGADPYGNGANYLQPIYNGDGADKEQVTNEQKLTGAGTADAPNTETVRFYHLPKYDYYGRVLHYTVTETASDAMQKADYSVSVHDGAYESVADDAAYGTDGHDKKAVEVENRRTGTKSVKFHKKWIDKAAYKAGNRPDIFLMLYRLDSQEREGVAPGVPVPNDYVEHEWSGHEKDDTDYLWTCTFDNLPKYDDNGAEITYYAEEGTHAHPEFFDYLDVQFASSKEEKDLLSEISWNEEKNDYEVTHQVSEAALAADTVIEDVSRPWVLTASDGKAVVKEDGWFVNELRAVVHVDGQKIWENIPNGFPVSELPKLDFVLNQREKEAADQTTPNVLDVSAENAGIEVAQIENLESTGLTFQFHFRYLGANNADGTPNGDSASNAWKRLLPKYDPKTGALYEYSVSEKIAEGQGNDIETAYEKLPGAVNNYVITNTYNAIGGVAGNTGKISVEKNWNSAHDAAADKITAAATFELYRFYENAARTAYLGVSDGHGELVKRVTVQPSKETPSLSAVADFGEQLVTAPNGKPYLYYIKEAAIGGFDCVLEAPQGGEPVAPNEKLTNWPIEAEGEGCSDVFRFKADEKTDDAADAVPTYGDVTLEAQNTYDLNEDSGQITLQASKVWKDQNNLGGLRPSAGLTFSLYREAEGQPEADGNNEISRERLGTVEISCRSDDSETLSGTFTAEPGAGNVSDKQPAVQVDGSWKDETWQFAVSSLDKWAPNGMMWKYTLVEEKEKIPDGYSENIKNETTIDSGLDPERKEMVLSPITNENITSLRVEKNWAQNADLLRKDTTYALQVKEEGGAYQWAAVYLSRFPDWNKSIDETKKIAAGENFATWEELPDSVRNSSGKAVPLTWRAVEIRIGEEDVRFGEGSEGAVYQTGNPDALKDLSVEYALADKQPAELLFVPSQSETRLEESTEQGTQPRTQFCTVTNTPMGGTVSLEITKTWKNDSSNKFYSRPMENGNWKVSYLVQRTTDGGTTYETVLDRNHAPYVVAVSAASGDTATIRVENLPKYDGESKAYAYVAREAVKVKDTWEIVDNETHRLPGYTVTGNDAAPQKNDAGYVSATVNSYETTSYRVGKNWIGDDASFRPEVGADMGADAEDVKLTLWVFDTGADTWKKASEYWPEVSEENFLPSAVDTAAETGAEASWIFTFEDLPKTDPNGEPYRYGVSEAKVAGYTDPVYSEIANDSGDEKIMELASQERPFGNTKVSAVLANYATAFSLEKTGFDGKELYAPYKVELTLTGAEEATVGYRAVWTQDVSGDGKIAQRVQVTKNGTAVYTANTSDAAGGGNTELLVKGLPTGSYTLTETITPQGSIPLAGSYTVTLASDTTEKNANGKTMLSVRENETAEDLVKIAGTSSDKVTVQNVATRFALVKTDATASGKKLEGAEFTLSGRFPAYFAQYVTANAGKGTAEAEHGGTGSSGEAVAGSIVLVTDSDGKAHLKEKTTSRSWLDALLNMGASADMIEGLLIAGENYTLQETKAPDGYAQIDGTLAFTVGNDGALTITGPVQDYTLAAKDGEAGTHYGVLTAADTPIALTLAKQDTAGNPLAGAEFALYEADGTEPIAEELRTGADGTIDLSAALSPHKFIVGKTYTLLETRAPEGYILPGDPSDPQDTQNRRLSFMVTEDGKITAGAVPQDSIFAGMGTDPTDTIVAKNKPIAMKLHKTNEDETKNLVGATFSLERKGDSLTGWMMQAENLKTNGEGILTLGMKKAGNSDGQQPDLTLVQGVTYRLTETKTSSSAYQMPQDAAERRVTFTVNTDGTVTIDEAQSNMEIFRASDTDDAVIVMKNELTKFVLRKVDNETEAEIADEMLELCVEAVNDTADDSEARTQVFTWQHTAEGYRIAVTASEGYGDLTIDSTTGVVSGLPAGTYRVSETKTPNGYLTIAPFTFTLDAYNRIDAEDKAYVTVEDEKTGTADSLGQAIVIADEVIRGHVTLTKNFVDTYEAGGPLEGVHFDLYRVNGEVDGDSGNGTDDTDMPDTKIAEDLVTDAEGTWTSVKNDRDRFTDDSAADIPFSTGLRSGTYYFAEAQATADGRLDRTPQIFTIAGEGKLPEDADADASAQDFGMVQPSDEGHPVAVEVINEAFAASLALTKRDAQTKEPINKDVFFHLEKRSNEADGVVYAQGMTVTPYEQKGGVVQEISEDGTLTFEGLTKGTYLLSEVSAKGYEEASLFAAEVVIGEADNGKTVTVKAEDETVQPQHFHEVAGRLTEDGIENTRKAASLTLRKRDADDTDQVLTDVTFVLQRRVDTGAGGSTDTEGSAVYENCMTVRTGYEYAFAQSQSGGEESGSEPKPTEDGALRLTGIPWGEYRLLETKAKDGYGISEKEAADPLAVVREFSVAREDFDEDNTVEVSIDDLVNHQTSLTLKKQGTDGVQKLSGAVFSISGERFAKEENAGRTSIEVTTGADGSVALQGVLVTGITYTLREIKAPNGYQLIETPLQFTLTADGTAELKDGAVVNGAYTLVTAGSYENVLVITDVPQQPQTESESESEKPSDPQKPSDPTEPQTDPQKPSDPTDPPTEPSDKPSPDQGGRNPQSSAKTGDETKLLLYILLMLASGTAGAALFVHRRRRHS